MLEFLLEPLVDTYYFGCPDSCIRPNGNTHEFLKILFTPLVVLGVSFGVAFATLFALGRLPTFESLGLRNLRSFKIRKEKPINNLTAQELTKNVVTELRNQPESIAELEHAIKRDNKKEFLKDKDLNPELAFDKFVNFQDPNHPLTDNLKTVRTEPKDDEKTLEEAFPIQKETPEELAKEFETPEIEKPEVKMSTTQEQEFYQENKDDLEKQARKITELMKKENLSEDEATDRVIREMEAEDEAQDLQKKIEAKVEEKEKVEVVDMDIDVFQQDTRPKIYPKHIKFLQKQFKKKEKPKYKFSLTELGSIRRDQYAKQIEVKLQEWAFPMPKYAGKNQELQIPDELVKSELKNLSLFMSMCEMLADKRKSKKSYWERIRVVK